MGRAKLNMELIQKEKSRTTTFKKRKEGLLRKIREFTTLCGVSACMIIYGPKNAGAEPEIWPRDADEVRRIIDIYKAKSKDSGNKTSGLLEFFHERKRKIEDELAKLRRKNMLAKYPTWMGFMDGMQEHHLREFAAALAGKVEMAKSRIQFLRSSGGSNIQEWGSVSGSGMGIGLDVNRIGQSSHPNFSLPEWRGNEWHVMNQQAAAIIAAASMDTHGTITYQPAVAAMEHHQQQPQQQEFDHHQVNAMTWQIENGNAFMAGPSTSEDVQNSAASHRVQFTYEAAAGTGGVDNQVMSARTFGWFHSAPVPPYAMHMVQQLPPLPPSMQFPGRGENEEDAGGGSFK